MEVGFGTSGLRGTAEALLAGAAAAHVRSFCRYLVKAGSAKPGDAVYVGADLRASSPALLADCMRAIAASGLAPVACGAVPTPALAHYALARNCAAIMVTGSHIPADRNGLKFYTPSGEITKQDELAIAAGLAEAPAIGEATQADGRDCHDEVLENWRARYRGVIEPGLLAGLKIGIDEHSTVAAGSLAEILAGFGAEIVRFGRLDRFEPLDTEAVDAARLQGYAARLARNSLFAIATADPDGDRPLLVDETGRALRGDLLGWIAARWLGADALAVPVNANSAIVSGTGIAVIRTRIGSPYVLEAMEKAKRDGARTVVGFEPNGGFMLGSEVDLGSAILSPLPTRDAVLPILAALQTAVYRKQPLSALGPEAGFRSTASDRIKDFPLQRSRRLMARLEQDADFLSTFVAPVGEVVGTDRTDGLRITLAGGSIVHLRPSGNAPEMRCYVEADSEADAARLLEWGLLRIAELAPEAD